MSKSWDQTSGINFEQLLWLFVGIDLYDADCEYGISGLHR
jgi:hypothetical protein